MQPCENRPREERKTIMAQRKNQTDHDSMVQSVLNHLSQNGYTNVKADLQGYPLPDPIHWTGKEQEGHIPDVTGDYNGHHCLFEIETEDSISTEHTASQLTLFAAYAKQYKKSFYVVVPKGYEGSAKEQLNRLGITAAVWTVG